MKLSIPYPMANKLHQAFGITEERSNEISDSLDKVGTALLKRLTIGEVSDFSVAEHLGDIAALVDTPEELVYALFNHIRWLKKKNIEIV